MIGAGGFEFASLDARVHLLWAVLAVAAIALLAERRRRRALRLFQVGEPGPGLGAVARRRRVRLALLTGGLLLLLFASLEPRTNPVKIRAQARVRDLAILLDVSRSMLAEDRRPNRLESVKLEIRRLLDHLHGDRVGLVAFAGDAVVVAPLTSNYSYVKRVLRTVSPAAVGLGGTKIGDAIRKAARDLLGLSPVKEEGSERPAPGETVLEASHRERKGRFADLLLLTDGEDHGSYPVDAVKSHLAPHGVGLYVVGVGSPEGRTIPTEEGGPLEYRGKPVRSALREKALRELVVAAGRGRYLPASVHHFDLVDFYEKVVRKDEGREVTEERVEWQEVFQPFLFGGLALVLLAFAVPLAPGAREPREEEP